MDQISEKKRHLLCETIWNIFIAIKSSCESAKSLSPDENPVNLIVSLSNAACACAYVGWIADIHIFFT